MSKKLKDSVLFGLLPNCFETTKNHYLSDCLVCGKEGHFYINRDTQLWDCKKCKNKGNIFSFLKSINKLNLLVGETAGIIYEFDRLEKKVLDFTSNFNVTDEDLVMKKVLLPIGYKRLLTNKYLLDRGITSEEFTEYEFGKTTMFSDLKDYIIMPIRENGECYAYLSRSEKSKDQISAINEKYKSQGLRKKYLRWKNSNHDFKKLLDGFDDVMQFDTSTVVLVEGRFARIRIKRLLKKKPNLFDGIVCCATFGKGISLYQIYKLLTKGVKNVILMYDADAVEEIKTISFDILHYFEVIGIGVINDNEDIDDMSDEDILRVFKNIKTPYEYFNNHILKRTL